MSFARSWMLEKRERNSVILIIIANKRTLVKTINIYT